MFVEMGETETELQKQLSSVGKKLETPPLDEKELLVVLEEAESLLLKVEQSPSKSMFASLRPVVDALVAKEFLSHANVDVKVSVATCISEITRITAPDAPYSDELMKDVFEIIVEAFKGLDNISSSSFSKRLSILETVAKVRSCVVMLDLECDGLILDMFRNFLATIRDSHSENVFSLMETIMTLVLEESEEISSELLSCLLFSVKNDNKDILPIARALAEKVIGNCSTWLKANLLELIQSTGTSLSDYSRIVVSICQDNPDLRVNNNHNTLGECLEDDSKLSERTISEEMQQGPGGKGLEAGYSGKPAKAPTSNGTIHKDVEVPSKGKNRKKGASQGHDAEKSAPSVLSAEEKKSNSIVSPNVADARPRRGRPPGSKPSAKKTANSAVDHSPALQLKKISVKQQPGAVSEPLKDIATEKQVEEASGSEEKPLRHMGKKGLGKTNQVEKAPENICSKKEDGARSDSEARSPRLAGRMKKEPGNGKSSEKSPRHRRRSRKESNASEKDLEEQTLEEMTSTPNTRIRSSQDENKSERLKTTSTKKRGRGEVISKSPAGADLDERLVGSHIQVWWPEDKTFYPGVVTTYFPSTKKHRVLYTDNEIEVLRLKNEKWEFINEDNQDVEDGHAHALDSHDVPSKKSKVDPDSTAKQTKAAASLKGNTTSTKLKGDVSRSKGKSVGSKRKLSERTGDPCGEDLEEKTDSESARIAGKTSKSSKQKDETPNASNDSEKDRPKSGIRSKAGSPKTVDNTPKNKNIVEKSGNTSKKQNSHSVEEISEGSTRAGRKIKGATTKSIGKSGGNFSPTKGMLSMEIEETKDSDAKVKSNSGKTSDISSRNRRRSGRS